MGRILQTFRRIFASILFLLLILYVGGAVSEIYGFDPSILSRVQFVPALLAGSFGIVVSIILFTLFFGRWYCSFLCPLGILQDIMNHFVKKKVRVNSGSTSSVIRYCILASCFISLFYGAALVFLLVDPWSVFGRLTTTFVLPPITFINNVLANLFNHFGLYGIVAKEYNFAGFSVLLIATFSLLLLGYFLFYYGGRFWCNVICPVGTILSVIAKKSFMRVYIDGEKCISCGLCEKNCKAGVISVKTKHVNSSNCVNCFNCLPVCENDAIFYGFSSKRKSR